MDKLLTVVIPSYNVEKFLNQTLDSFVCDDAVMKNSRLSWLTTAQRITPQNRQGVRR